MLATLIVREPTDDISALDGLTLREAVIQANNDAGPDTIEFDPLLDGQPIFLAFGPLPEITESLTIRGLPAAQGGLDPARIRIETSNILPSQILVIGPQAGDVTIEGLTLSDGLSPGNGGAIESLTSGMLTLSDMIITGGNATNDGGAVHAAGPLNISSSTFTLNDAVNGGAIFSGGGDITITSSTFEKNFARASGGAIYGDGGNLSIGLSDFLDNNATINGGAIYVEGGTLEVEPQTVISQSDAVDGAGVYLSSATATIESTVSIDSNTATGNGAGIYTDSDLDIAGATIETNDAALDGGGIYASGTGVTIEITNQSTIKDNTARDGAGIYTTVPVNIRGQESRIESNIAAGNGGGIHSTQTVQISDGVTVILNQANLGGGLYVDSVFGGTITGSTVTENTALASGGGIYATGTSLPLTFRQSIISKNTASGDGGGVFLASANVVVDDTTISENSVTSINSKGGGLFATSPGDLTITRSTIQLNTAQHKGGGLSIENTSGTATIDSSTISSNFAVVGAGANFVTGAAATTTILQTTISSNEASFQGGGAHVENGIARFRHSTITLNQVPQDGGGGGIYVSSGASAVLDHSIVARNTGFLTTPDADGVVDARYSLIGDNTGAIINDQGGNQIGQSPFPIDPQLQPLGDYGGPTETHSPFPGSPAINTGDSSIGSPPAFDQRGAPHGRVVGQIDIGAVEGQQFAGPFVVDTISDQNNGNLGLGDLSLRELIDAANSTLGNQTITFAPNLHGDTITLALGEMPITDTVTIEGPGAELLTIDANSLSRIFHVNDGDSADATVEISGLTLANGRSTEAQGGGAILSHEDLTLRDVAITSGRAAGGSGGGIRAAAGSLEVHDSAITGSDSTGPGGAIATDVSTLIQNSTINSNNTSGDGGGIASFSDLTISNSTLSGNNASGSGGGLFANSAADIVHTTITLNTAPKSGDPGTGAGVFAGGDVTLDHTIAAGNIDNSGLAGDLHQSVGRRFVSFYSVIGNNSAATIVESPGSINYIGTAANPLDPGLVPLDDNGGPTDTHALLSASPALNTGQPDIAALPQFDQRGPDFDRVSGPGIDIGAFEYQFANAPTVANPIADHYVDENFPDSVIDLSNVFADADIPFGDSLALSIVGNTNSTLVSTSPEPFHGTDLTLGYAPNQSGTATITVQATDLEGLTADTQIDIRVIPLLLTVTTTSDENHGQLGAFGDSLREVMEAANRASGANTIQFDSNLGSSIMLGGSQLPTIIYDLMDITGPGADRLTINANDASGVFRVAPATSVAISGLKVLNGAEVNGGALFNQGDVTLTAVEFVGNRTNGGSGARGGAIYAAIGSTTELVDSTLAENISAGPGGGVFNQGTLTIINSTLSGNQASSSDGGGGIRNEAPGTVWLTNVTIANNRAGFSGAGGGGISTNSSKVTLHNTIVANNFVGSGSTASDIDGEVNASASSYNLIGAGDTSGLTDGVDGNQIDVANARLGGLLDNGGPTRTHALSNGSPAIDAGDIGKANDAALTDDQRRLGLGRQYGSSVDIGAYELHPETIVWDGGGGDNNWFNAANWFNVTTGQSFDLPGFFDHVEICTLAYQAFCASPPNFILVDGRSVSSRTADILSIQSAVQLTMEVVTFTVDQSSYVSRIVIPRPVQPFGDVIIQPNNQNEPATLDVDSLQIDSNPFSFLSLDLDVNVVDVENAGGHLQGVGTVTVTGSMLWTNGQMSGTGKTAIAQGATLTIDPSRFSQMSMQQGRTLENFGTTTRKTGDSSSFGWNIMNSQIINHGLFDIQGGLPLGSSNSSLFTNNGMLRKSADPVTLAIDTSTVGIVLDNTDQGTVEVNSGTLRFLNGGTSSGDFVVAENTTLDLSGAGLQDYTINLPPGRSISGNGTLKMSHGNVTIQGDGTVDVDTINVELFSERSLDLLLDVTVPHVTLAAGIIGGSAALTVTDSMDWIAGRMEEEGKTIIASTATLNVQPGPNGSVSLHRTLENFGIVNFDANPNADPSAWRVNLDATIHNMLDASFNIQSDRNIAATPIPGSGQFTNEGTLIKLAGGGTTQITTGFVNTGVAEVGTGTLFFHAFNQIAGETLLAGGNLSSNQTLNFDGGALTGAGTVFGNVSQTSGQILPGGDSPGILTIDDNYNQSGGSLDIQLGGTAVGTEYDQLVVNGTVSPLDGALNVSFVDPYQPIGGESYTVLNGTTNSGFASENLPVLPSSLEWEVVNGSVVLNTIITQDTTAPTAILTAPIQVEIGQSFTLDGSASFDPPPGQIATYRWSRVGGLINGVATIDTTEPTLTLSSTGYLEGSETFELVVTDAFDNESISADAVVLFVAPQADMTFAVPMTVEEVIPDGQLLVGDQLAVTFFPKNGGPQVANNVQFQMVLPTGLELTSVDISGISNPVIDVTGQIVTVELGSLVDMEDRGGQFILTATEAGMFTLDVSVSADELDPLPGNNLDSSSFTVSPPPNAAPTVTVDDGSVTVDEGDVAQNTGAFDDIDGDTVTIKASIGKITQDDATKTWSWLYATDGTDGDQTVTITATDTSGEQATASFQLTVHQNLIVDLNGPDGAGIDHSGTFSEDGGPVTIVDSDLTVGGGTSGIVEFGKIGSEFQVNSTTANQQFDPSLASGPAGNSVVTWSDFVGIYGQRYDASGTPVGAEFQINSFTNGNQLFPSVAMDRDGNFVAVWESGDAGLNIYGQRYDAAGAPVGTQFRVNSLSNSDQFPTVVMDAAGNFAVVWFTFNGIHGQRYDASGGAQGVEFQVNASSPAVFPTAAMDSAGNFVVIWSSDHQNPSGWDLFGQRYDASGTAAGAEFQINSTPSEHRIISSVAMDPAGNFVVSWSDRPVGGNGGNVYGRRYDASGAPVGNDFQINSASRGAWPSVAMDAGGSFVVTWDGYDQDDNASGIYGQRYDSSGAPVSSEFQINSDTSSRSPFVGTDEAGHFTVVWSTFDGSGSGIYGQRYSSGFELANLIDSATVTITNLVDEAAETLTVDTAGTVLTASYNVATGELRITGIASAADYERVLRTTTYHNSSQDPDTTDRLVTFVVTAGAKQSDMATSTVSVVSVNQRPIASSGGPYLVDEGSLLQLDASGTSDPDQDQMTLTYEWDLDYDGSAFNIDATGNQPSVSFLDNFAARQIAVRVTDIEGASDIGTAMLEVVNVEPMFDDGIGVDTILLTDNGGEPDISDDGMRVVWTRQSSWLHLYDTVADADTVVQAVFQLERPVLSGDGSRIFYEDVDRFDVSEGGEPRRIMGIHEDGSFISGFGEATHIGVVGAFGSSSTDGTSVAFERPDSDSNETTSEFRQVTLHPTFPNSGSIATTTVEGFYSERRSMISGDALSVVFVSNGDRAGGNPDQNDELFLGTRLSIIVPFFTETQITNTSGIQNRVPSISADATKVVFLSDGDFNGLNADGNTELFLYDVSAGLFRQLTDTTGDALIDAEPDIGAEGAHVAFTSTGDLVGQNPDGSAEVFVMDLASDTILQVTETTGVNHSPAAINTDGTRVVFENDSTPGSAVLLTTLTHRPPFAITLNQNVATIDGSFTDPGTDDTHTIDIRWGDGETSSLAILQGDRSFNAGHDFPVNTTNEPIDYQVRLTVTDDDGGSSTSIANVTIEPRIVVADPPSDQEVNEDADPLRIDVASVFQHIEGNSEITLSVESSESGLVSASVDGTELVLMFGKDENGTADITVTASDSLGASVSGTFGVIVNSVNDAPSFLGGSDVFALENSGRRTIAGWASGMSAGPANESDQTLTFEVQSNTNPAIFGLPPFIDPATGDLSFAPAANANGDATLTVVLTDDGGTDHGGSDTSGPHTFTIHVIPETLIVTTALDEDDGQLGLGDGDSLREVIHVANQFSGHNTIVFADIGPSISLTRGSLPEINDDLTINGPGSDRLSIGYNSTATIFTIRESSSRFTPSVEISGLTITEGLRGIWIVRANATVRDSIISRNDAGSENGGGILNGPPRQTHLTVERSLVTDNRAANGAGIYNFDMEVDIVDSTIARNIASGDGGGLWLSNEATIISSVISENESGGVGGGIFFRSPFGEPTIIGSTISFNQASGDGGGVFTNAPVTIVNSTLSDNTAGDNGGALFSNQLGIRRIVNSTISGNQSGLSGGGLFVQTGSSTASFSPTLRNVTIANNRANADSDSVGEGGGIFTNFAVLYNTIVAGNFVGSSSSDIFGSDVDAIGSLIGDDTGVQFGSIVKTITNVDPMLAVLANNGGPTLTHALFPSSPAINAGSDDLAVDLDGDPLVFDQRGEGFTRFNGVVDIGAFETDGPIVVNPIDDVTMLENGIDRTIDLSGVFSSPIAEDLTLTLEANSNAGLVMTSFADPVLDLRLVLDQIGVTTITIRATDQRGYYVEDDFDVSVIPLIVTTAKDENDSGLGIGSDSLREILAATNTVSGAPTITFAPHVTGTIALDAAFGQLAISDDVTIQGPTNRVISVDGNSNGFRVFDVAAGTTVTISDLTITGGQIADTGAGLWNKGTLTLERVTVTGNTSTETQFLARRNGGGITNEGDLTIIDSMISNNESLSDAGGILNLGTLQISGGAISGNTANNDGGAIQNSGTAMLNDVIVVDNGASRGGGLFNSVGAALNLTGTTIDANVATNVSTAAGGGGLFNSRDGNVTIADGTFTGNSADSAGGAIFNAGKGTLSITGGEFSGNNRAGTDGGAIYNSGSLTVTGATFNGNTAVDQGGAIFHTGAVKATLDGLTISGSTARQGAGLFNAAQEELTVTESTIDNNTATTFDGGGIFNDGVLTLQRTTLSRNQAPQGGSGVGNTGVLVVLNSTISNNTGFGAILNLGVGTVSLLNATVAYNVGAGIFNQGLQNNVLLHNTIVAANSTAAGNSAEFVLSVNRDSSHNLIGANASDVDSGGPLTGQGNIYETSTSVLGLSPLGNHLGPTETHALQSGSPALNYGSDSLAGPIGGLSTDQRGKGFTRFSGVVDIGAYEASPRNFFVDTESDTDNGDYSAGDLSLREAIRLANDNAGSDSISFVLPQSATITLNGSLPLITDDVSIFRHLFLPLPPVTIGHNSSASVFTISGTSNPRVSISGVTMEDVRRGISNHSTAEVTISDVTISKSDSRSFQNPFDSKDGGAILNSGLLSIHRSTLWNNKALNGGAIHNTGDLSIFNSTISQNKAARFGGGGIHNDTGTVLIVNSTIAENEGDNGAGIWTTNQNVTLHNTIVANNVGQEIDGLVNQSSSHNVISYDGQFVSGSGGLTNTNGNQVGVRSDAVRLGELANNGGTTLTHALLAGSVAIDEGSNDIVDTHDLASDQRGEPRRLDGDGNPATFVVVDVGAFEATGTSQTFIVDSTADEADGDYSKGRFSLREAIGLANESLGRDIIRFDLPADATKIPLDQGSLPAITDDVSIVGPSADQLSLGFNTDAATFTIGSFPSLLLAGTGPQPDVSISGLTIRGGQHITNSATLSLHRSVVTDNHAPASGVFGIDRGGGIQNNGTLLVQRSVVWGNRAQRGGGIYNTGTLNVYNSTISRNEASDSGGGIYNTLNGTGSLINATIAENGPNPGGPSSIAGAGIFTDDLGNLKLTNTIVANNVGTEMTGLVDSASSHNVIGSDGGFAVAGGLDNTNGNQVNVHADGVRLGELTNNGGSTPTHALLAGSVAIDQGKDVTSPFPIFGDPFATDQRGEARKRDGDGLASTPAAVDVGAYEALGTSMTWTVDHELDEDDGNHTQGNLSLREAIGLANENLGWDIIDFVLPAGIQRIQLEQGSLPSIRDDLTIDGPGADQLAVGDNRNSFVFTIGTVLPFSSGPQPEVEVSGLTIRGSKHIRNAATLTLFETSITDNDATAVGFFNPTVKPGGGIYNIGTLNVNRSTLWGNRAGTGGGIHNSGTLHVVNSTISGNTADDSGGGLHNSDGTVLFLGATVTENRADADGQNGGRGGGVSTTNTDVTLYSTIVAENFVGTGSIGSEFDGTVDSISSSNLIGTQLVADGGGVPAGQENVFVAERDALRLGPLDDNGGRTRTHALLNGSPAIDAGLTGNIFIGSRVFVHSTDQRGESRPFFGGGGDIGAFELIDDDSDGVDNAIEDRAPNGGDGNSDGVPDSQQANVASLRNSIDGMFVTVAAPDGLSLSNVRATRRIDGGPSGAPARFSFPIGRIGFTVSGLTTGGSTTVEINLESGIAANFYVKTRNIFSAYEFLYDGNTGAELIDADGDGLVEKFLLHFVDGDRGDNDLQPNGVIVDPGAPAFNPAPVVEPIIGLDVAVPQHPLLFNTAFSDLGDEPHTATFDWGDGISEAGQVDEATGGGTISGVHAYAEPGDYVVRLEVTDQFGNVAMVDKQITLNRFLLSEDPDNPETQILTVGGTRRDDHIDFKSKKKDSILEVSLNGDRLIEAPTESLSRLVAYAGEGNDDIKVHGQISIPSEFYGGPGKDHLQGGRGDDALFGGLGNDKLKGSDGDDILVGGDGADDIDGGKGRDVAIGGLGSDEIKGGQDGDILIGGFTVYDDNLRALEIILSKWQSRDDDYDTRVKTVTSDTDLFVDESFLERETTLRDDAAEDELKSVTSHDLVFAGPKDELDLDDDEEDDDDDDDD